MTTAAESFPVPTISTFVVRFWHEWSAGGSRWRGRIEHIPTGRSAAFLDEEAMWQFIQSFGVTLGDANQSRVVESRVLSEHGEISDKNPSSDGEKEVRDEYDRKSGGQA